MNCILLALGLSISQPLLDYLLLLNLQDPLALQSNNVQQQQPTTMNAIDASLGSEAQYAASLLASPPPNLVDGQIGAANSDYFATTSGTAKQIAAESLLLLQSAASSKANALLANNELLTDNSLLIPMTSQLSKVSFSMCVIEAQLVALTGQIRAMDLHRNGLLSSGMLLCTVYLRI